MKWSYDSAQDAGGYEDGEFTNCTVCKDPIHDIIYFPIDMDNFDIHWIEKIWKCDAHTDFFVCEDCMQGYCGAVKGRNANNWLQGEIKAYKEDHKDDVDDYKDDE